MHYASHTHMLMPQVDGVMERITKFHNDFMAQYADAADTAA